MVEKIQSTYFGDKFRSTLTLVLLVCIMVVLVVGYFHPRNQIDAKTIDKLSKVVQQFDNTTQAMTQNLKVQNELTSQLKVTLDDRTRNREDSYNDLLSHYGSDGDYRVWTQNNGVRSTDEVISERAVSTTEPLQNNFSQPPTRLQ